MRDLTIPTEILDAIDRGAVLALSVSGGKDSQAMMSAVTRWLIETDRDNDVIAVHSDLGRAEWFDTPREVERQCEMYGVDLHVVRRAKGDMLARFEERAEKVGDDKPFWASSSCRYCTAELKRDPINTYLRTLGPLVISVEGIRREESPARSKKATHGRRSRIETRTREAWTWNAILDWTMDEVWAELGTSQEALDSLIAEVADLEDFTWEIPIDYWPAHPAYVRGISRLSCSICILATERDMRIGARWNPEYLDSLVGLERRYGWTFTQKISLVDLAESLKTEA